MRTVSDEEIRRRWSELRAEAERTGIRVHAEGEPDLVVLPSEEYERYRKLVAEKLIDMTDRIGAEALRRGLTEEMLDELLADES